MVLYYYTNIKMKETMTWTQCLEKRDWKLRKSLWSAALIWALSLLSPMEWSAKTVSGIDEGAEVTEVTQQWTEVGEEEKKTISLIDAVQWMEDEWITESDEKEEPWVEPDPEPIKKPTTKFTVSTWVGYTVGGSVKWVNRIQWSGEFFQGSPFSLGVTWVADLDDPMHSRWSWKVILWKPLYMWITMDWDYTFTGTGGNIFRFGIGYWGQIWKWVYGIKLFPLNTNWSTISAKVFVSTKVWKWWELSSFVLVDFDKWWYYGEAEYTQRLAEWIAMFIQARLWGALDGKIGTWDTQSVLWWLKIDIR